MSSCLRLDGVEMRVARARPVHLDAVHGLGRRVEVRELLSRPHLRRFISVEHSMEDVLPRDNQVLECEWWGGEWRGLDGSRERGGGLLCACACAWVCVACVLPRARVCVVRPRCAYVRVRGDVHTFFILRLYVFIFLEMSFRSAASSCCGWTTVVEVRQRRRQGGSGGGGGRVGGEGRGGGGQGQEQGWSLAAAPLMHHTPCGLDRPS